MEQTEPINDTQEVRNQIARIAISNSFKRRRRLLELFEYLVSETMSGRHELLTQKKIAADVYRLGTTFDPQSDGTVRIAAARLRNAIEDIELAPPRKKIGPNDILGELGVNLIQRICLEMGFVWYSTGLEAGIDGYIEIRSESGNVTNCIIQVQSK